MGEDPRIGATLGDGGAVAVNSKSHFLSATCGPAGLCNITRPATPPPEDKAPGIQLAPSGGFEPPHTAPEADRFRAAILLAHDDGDEFDRQTCEPDAWSPTPGDTQVYEWARRWLSDQWAC